MGLLWGRLRRVPKHARIRERPLELTLQGMMAVKPGLTGRVPCAVKVSPAAVKAAEVRKDTASGDSEPRKWRQM